MIFYILYYFKKPIIASQKRPAAFLFSYYQLHVLSCPLEANNSATMEEYMKMKNCNGIKCFTEYF